MRVLNRDNVFSRERFVGDQILPRLRLDAQPVDAVEREDVASGGDENDVGVRGEGLEGDWVGVRVVFRAVVPEEVEFD